MKFKGQPNLIVRVARTTPPQYLKFDDKGYYETDNVKLIARLKPHFKVVEEKKKEENTAKKSNNLVKTVQKNKIADKKGKSK